MEKICIKCEEKKELNKFDKRNKSKDGYRNQCKDCLYKKRKDKFLNLTNDEKEKFIIKKKELSKFLRFPKKL